MGGSESMHSSLGLCLCTHYRQRAGCELILIRRAATLLQVQVNFMVEFPFKICVSIGDNQSNCIYVELRYLRGY